jgi:hypothetical integral membrane protein (TIGR02206 family)
MQKIVINPMNCDFFQTVETIPPGRGFPLFGAIHLAWLTVFLLIAVINCYWYRKRSIATRLRWRRGVAILLIADEIFKFIVLAAGGNLSWFYLPLHLCSINIFLILWHAISPNRHIGAFLYTVCIPGAVAALLFPAWNTLPVSSAMHIHSFTAHILLALYPVVLTAAGEIRPTLRQLPLCLAILAALAGLVYGVNLLLGTNFMFLMYAEEGNPLAWFYIHWGSHLWGFPVIAAGVIAVMYLPMILCKKFNH